MLVWWFALVAVLLLIACTVLLTLLVRERLFLHRAAHYMGSTTAAKAQPQLLAAQSAPDRRFVDALEALIVRNREELTTVAYERQVLHHILQNMTTGVVMLGQDSRVAMMNDAAAKMFRQPVRQCLGFEHWSVFRQHLSLCRAIDRTLTTGQPWHDELDLRSDLTVDVRLIAMQPTLSQNDGLYAHGVLLLLTDVSQWRRLEKMRSDFVANVSHELKTPITAIRGFAETLLDEMEDGTGAGFVQVIVNEAERMRALVADLMTLSKLEAAEDHMDFESVDLSALIQRAVATVTPEMQKHNVTLHAGPCDGITVWGDQNRLLQVLLNLLVNAAHYTPAGGSVEVYCEPLIDRVRVHVTDTGIGIPKDQRDRVFERFYRVDRDRSRATGGTGLGLSIVKHIVSAHGGLVGVDSRSGGGSDFWFTIPLLSK